MIRKTLPWSIAVPLAVICILLLGVSLGLADDDAQATAADWLAALATLFTLVVAVIAGWFLAGTHAIEVDRENARVDQAKREQASQVAFWYDIRLNPLANVAPTPWSLFGIWIRNASQLPVFDAEVDVFVGGALLGTSLVAMDDTGRPGVIPPTGSATFRGLGQAVGEALEGLRPPANTDGSVSDPPIPAIALYFTDAAGQRWVRMSDGRLLERDSLPGDRWGA